MEPIRPAARPPSEVPPPDRARPGAPRARSFAFPPARRLKRRRLIRPLFDRSRTDVGTVTAGCLRALYRWAPEAEVGQAVPFQVGFAPGRRFPGGVRRNRARRLMREAFRPLQPLLLGALAGRADILTVMILFRGDPAQAEGGIPRDLPRLVRRLAAAVAGPPPG